MNSFTVFVVFSSALCGVLAFENQPTDFGEESNDGPLDYLVPLPLLVRMRRAGPELKYALKCPGEDCWASIGGKGTIYQNNNHRFDASAYAAKDVSTNLNVFKPERTGGALDYSHIPSKSSVSLQADHTKGFGTDVSAAGRYNIVQQKDFQAGIEASYNKHYGGPMGNGPSDKAVFIKAEGKF